MTNPYIKFYLELTTDIDDLERLEITYYRVLNLIDYEDSELKRELISVHNNLFWEVARNKKNQNQSLS